MNLLRANHDAYALAESAIRDAAARARARKIRVRPGHAGVLWGELSGTWVEDPAEEGVSPVGAVLLGRETVECEPSAAASIELGVSHAWLRGVDDGFSGYAVAGRGSLYAAGADFGNVLRRELLR